MAFTAMHHGFCAPNDERLFTQDELEVIRQGRFTSAKLMWYHTKENIAQLRGLRSNQSTARDLPAYQGVQHFVGRLPTFHTWDKHDVHIAACWKALVALYPDVKVWQTDNEPNQPEGELGGWGRRAWDFAFYLRITLQRLMRWAKEAGMEGLTWVLPPLAYAPALWADLPVWKAAFTLHPDGNIEIPKITQLHQVAGANCYWQYPSHMLDGSFGMSWGDVQNWTGLPTVVLEYGCSAYLLTPEWMGTPAEMSMAAVHRQMEEQYPAYVKENARRDALGSYVFQVGGTYDWRGLAVPLRVAKALAPVTSQG